MEMMTISAQKAIDATPSALVSTTGRSWCSNASRKAYGGLVPISPNTTPSAPSANAPVPAADLAPPLAVGASLTAGDPTRRQ